MKNKFSSINKATILTFAFIFLFNSCSQKQEPKIENIELLKHQNGFGNAANSIVKNMVQKNTYNVDAISGATVSSKVIINAVNNALEVGLF